MRSALMNPVRTAVMALTITAAMLGTGASGAAAATGTPTLTAPAMSSTSGQSITVAYTLPDAPLANSIQLKFAGTTTTTLTLAGTALSNSFTFAASNPAASPHVSLVSGTSAIQAGAYTVTLSYQDAGGDPAASSVATNVTIDTTTQTPTLTAPVAGSAISGPMTVDYSLPEAAYSGSVQLTFTGAVTRTLTMVDASPSGAFQLDPSDPRASPEVMSIAGGPTIPDGTYTIAVSYQDYLQNPRATSQSGAVTIDNTTLEPTLITPANGATFAGAFAVSYSLPEAALGGSVKLTFAGQKTYTLTLADSATGTHSLTIDPTDPTAAADVTGMAGGTVISPGVYALTVSYEDAHGNPLATSLPLDTTVSPQAPTAPTGPTTPVTFSPPPPSRPTITLGISALTGPRHVTRRCGTRCTAPVFRFRATAAETVILHFSGPRGRRELTLTVSVRKAGNERVKLTREQLRRLLPGRVSVMATAGTTEAKFHFSVK